MRQSQHGPQTEHRARVMHRPALTPSRAPNIRIDPSGFVPAGLYIQYIILMISVEIKITYKKLPQSILKTIPRHQSLLTRSASDTFHLRQSQGLVFYLLLSLCSVSPVILCTESTVSRQTTDPAMSSNFCILFNGMSGRWSHQSQPGQSFLQRMELLSSPSRPSPSQRSPVWQRAR